MCSVKQEKLDWRRDSMSSRIRIFEFPKCKMVSSGYCKMDEAPFEEGGKLNLFGKWWGEYDKKRTDRWFSRDFMMYGREEDALIWYYAIPDNAVIDCEFEVIDFEGGLYASDVAIMDNSEDEERVFGSIKEWIENSEIFELDERPGHYDLSHGITSAVENVMGYMQLEIYVPIKLRN
jgi:hypothetical protein